MGFRVLLRGLAIALMWGAFGVDRDARAQGIDAGSTFRVFLKDGKALPTFGDSAQVQDRLVFNLLVGRSDGSSLLQLMSLPVALVDLDRTRHYATAVRAAQYAVSGGDADYRAMTAEVSRALDALPKVADPKRRLEMAEDARRRLLAWPREHFGYRASDVRELAGLFEDVIVELRAAAGESAFSLDLRAGQSDTPGEPLQPRLTLRESIEAALFAASVADEDEERVAILRTAVSATAAERGAEDLSAVVVDRLAAELRVDAFYAALADNIRSRADAALGRADVKAIEQLFVEIGRRDVALGSERPSRVRALESEVAARLDRARAFRVSLDHYAYIRPRLVAFERRLRPTLAAFEGLRGAMTAIQNMHGMPFERLIAARDRLARLAAGMSHLEPPANLAQVHETLTSALRMAHEACVRRRMSVIANDVSLAREASSAAAGALLLLDQARADLAAGVAPPTLK